MGYPDEQSPGVWSLHVGLAKSEDPSAPENTHLEPHPFFGKGKWQVMWER